MKPGERARAVPWTAPRTWLPGKGPQARCHCMPALEMAPAPAGVGASGRLLEIIVIQEATQGLLAAYLGRSRWLGWVGKAHRDEVAQSLMRPALVMRALNGF